MSLSETTRRVVDLPSGRRYCIVGSSMGIDFHFNDTNPSEVIAGLEMHYRECPSYLTGQSPFTDNCWLTGGVCYGDGTSIYATEWLYPLFKEMGLEAFWPILEQEYQRRHKDAFAEGR